MYILWGMHTQTILPTKALEVQRTLCKSNHPSTGQPSGRVYLQSALTVVLQLLQDPAGSQQPLCSHCSSCIRHHMEPSVVQPLPCLFFILP